VIEEDIGEVIFFSPIENNYYIHYYEEVTYAER